MKLKINLNNYSKKGIPTGIRLNKYLSDLGIMSRRETDKLINSKLIHINNKIAILGQKIKDGDSIFLNQKFDELKYFKYNKPRGEETKFKLLNGVRYEPIGRLDKESEGLLLYSNDFRIVEALLNPENKIEREYLVKIKEKTTPRVKTILERGINTREAKYAPAKSVILDPDNKTVIKIILTEGKKHEIRRMLNALNLTIASLKRTRILFITSVKMKIGEFKELNKMESKELLNLLNLK